MNQFSLSLIIIVKCIRAETFILYLTVVFFLHKSFFFKHKRLLEKLHKTLRRLHLCVNFLSLLKFKTLTFCNITNIIQTSHIKKYVFELIFCFRNKYSWKATVFR